MKSQVLWSGCHGFQCFFLTMYHDQSLCIPPRWCADTILWFYLMHLYGLWWWLIFSTVTITIITAVPISPSHCGNERERSLLPCSSYLLIPGTQEEDWFPVCHPPHRTITRSGFPGQKPHWFDCVNWKWNSFTSLHSHFGQSMSGETYFSTAGGPFLFPLRAV